MDKLKYTLLFLLLTPLLFAETLITPLAKETIIKNGITYTLKSRSPIKARLMSGNVYIKNKKQSIVLENNVWKVKAMAVIE